MCHNTGRKHVNESDNIDVDKNSQEKEGGFSFLDRPELEEHANTINESNKCRHRSLERGAYDGFTQIDQDMVSSAVDPSGQVIVVSSGLSSSGGDSSQTSQGSYRRAMENIITDYR